MDIELYQRHELPPAGGGQALIPYELADKSGQIRFGNTLAQMGENWMGKILAAQEATERSQAITSMNNEMADYEKWQNEHPENAHDEMLNGTEWKRRFGTEAKSRFVNAAKNKNAQRQIGLDFDHFASSYGLAMQKRAGARLAEQAVDATNNRIGESISKNDKEGLNKAIEDGIRLGTVSPGDGAKALREGNAEIDKQNYANEVENIRTLSQATVPLEGENVGDKKVGYDLIRKSNLSTKDKDTLYGALDNYVAGQFEKVKQDTDAFQIKMLMDLEKNKTADPVARNKIADESLLQLSQVKNLSRSDFTIMEKRLNDFRDGKATNSNSDAVIQAAKTVDDLRRGIGTEYSATSTINGLRNKLSDTDFEKYSIAATTKFTDQNLDFVNDSVNGYRDTFPMAIRDTLRVYDKVANFRLALEKWVNSPEGEKASPRDRYIYQKELAAELNPQRPSPPGFWHKTKDVLFGESFADMIAEADAAKQVKQKKPVITSQTKTDVDFDTYYNSLPSGAEFTAPDGTRRRKP